MNALENTVYPLLGFVIFLICFGGLWLGIVTLLAWLSGWTRLARTYRAASPATGDRFTTHVIAGEAGSGAVSALAGIHHPLRVGDSIAIICSALLHEGQILDHRARVVDVDEENRVVNLVESDVGMEP